MNRLFATLLLLLSLAHEWGAAAQAYRPRVEPAPCPIPCDKRLVVRYGYLVVPENRRQPQRRFVKIPFLFARRPDQAARRGVSLFSTGGPGYSTTANVDSLGYHSPLLRYGAVVLFDQRGTRRAQPCLTCPEIDQAVRRSYHTGRSRDSLVLAATQQCRRRLTRQGMDLAAYSTPESAEDINDLRQALRLDSLNLLGISYSGGLMLAVARQHPEAVRCLVLNSPLPSFVPYEQEALANIDAALTQVFARCEADTVAHPAYRQLGTRFRAYFTALTGQRFALPAPAAAGPASPTLTYSKSELLDALLSRLTAEQVATFPDVVLEMLAGHHARYGREQVTAALAGEPSLALGMRYSVYCAEQLADVSPGVLARQQQRWPWLAGYAFNNVTLASCACWAVPPAPASLKHPVVLTVPALLAAGELDPWCRPAYNQLLKRYLPHSQLLRWANRGHAPGFATDQLDYVALFLAHPRQPLPASPPAGLRLE